MMEAKKTSRSDHSLAEATQVKGDEDGRKEERKSKDQAGSGMRGPRGF